MLTKKEIKQLEELLIKAGTKVNISDGIMTVSDKVNKIQIDITYLSLIPEISSSSILNLTSETIENFNRVLENNLNENKFMTAMPIRTKITCIDCKNLKFNEDKQKYECSKGLIPNFIDDVSKIDCMYFRTF